MIHYIKGIITETMPGMVVIECGGIGYEVHVPEGDSAYLAGSQPVTIYTTMQVKEDDISLFGFSDRAALAMFNLLITVTGVGGKGAMAILSALNPPELASAIASGDAKAITSANGIGKKIADRIVLELKDKVEKLGIQFVKGEVIKPVTGERAKAVSMLVGSGATKAEAERAVASIEEDGLTAGQYFMKAARTFKQR